MKDQAIVVLNAGSSSIKFALYGVAGAALCPRYHGQIAGIALQGRFTLHDLNRGSVLDESCSVPDHAAALQRLLQWLDDELRDIELLAVGHRVVHGGVEFAAPVVVDEVVLQRLQQLIPLAPLHQPHNLNAIIALRQKRPDLPQVACFDTAFHHTRPVVAQRYALPHNYFERGIRSYGFHGLSYEYIASVLPEYLGDASRGRVIVAHLGNGASLCALRDGKSVATTMGFTPLDGLVMGTRCGAIDPGVLIYLLRQGMGVEALDELLQQRSGLLGLSGISSDMQTLLASSDECAAAAVEQFCYRVTREIGSLAAALGGVDAIVFSGGIGEHSAVIRSRICLQAQWLGVELDEAANSQHQRCISTVTSGVTLAVIATDEEQMVADHSYRLVCNI